jgi:hypothetical protein
VTRGTEPPNGIIKNYGFPAEMAILWAEITIMAACLLSIFHVVGFSSSKTDSLSGRPSVKTTLHHSWLLSNSDGVSRLQLKIWPTARIQPLIPITVHIELKGGRN